ncbi:MAG: hypothetical protein A4S12_01440 [Proteobacteria bacterium SG_bin5]|nr:MAG: hypothetical protein A4S12_01440 [Proteobacteria bacterium SG_bin5]
MNSPILAPVVALVCWTLVMWVWMYATRIPAMQRARIDARELVGTTGASLRADMIDGNERRATWVSDNYNHLHEQPTLFYAACFALALMGLGSGFNVALAWGYVGLRVAHSLVQATINRVIIRFSIFVLASLCLFALAIHAAMGLLHVHPLIGPGN